METLSCAWLVRRFIDRDGRICLLQADDLAASVASTNGIPFAVPGMKVAGLIELACFHDLLHVFRLETPSLNRMNAVVRAAALGDSALVPEANAITAFAEGLARSVGDDEKAILFGIPILDGLYSWCQHPPLDGHHHPWEGDSVISRLAERFSAFLARRTASKPAVALPISFLSEHMLRDVGIQGHERQAIEEERRHRMLTLRRWC